MKLDAARPYIAVADYQAKNKKCEPVQVSAWLAAREWRGSARDGELVFSKCRSTSPSGCTKTSPTLRGISWQRVALNWERIDAPLPETNMGAV